ncbi:MAG: RNA polymerase sigma-70 factor, partial [Chloroflexi bacterium]|nr:RNA polymerase sigma-70 factor [Chloroflexota bacterium]
HRPLLFAIAYEMLGSVMEAEDIVQESYLRWQGTAGEAIRSPRSYLATIATRLSIDRLRSAQMQREEYVGPWLPEPFVTGAFPGAAEWATTTEALSVAFMVLVEQLSPVERAVFLLREVFDYEYEEIAAIVEKSEANCRQMFSRARQRLGAGRPRTQARPEEQERLMQQFLDTCATGDLPGLLHVLAEDITVYSDGGGRVAAARRPIHGADKVARFLFGLMRLAPPTTDYHPAWVNGRPGMVVYVDGRPFNTLSVEVSDGRIQAIYIVVNPDKLRHLPPPA